MPFASEVVAAGQDQFLSSATPRAGIGTRIATADGRVFRYARASSALVVGAVCQGPATLPLHLGNTPPVVSAGAFAFVYTPGAIGCVANYYADGMLQVDTNPGAGYAYTVSGHDAIVSGTPFMLMLKDPIQVGLTGTSRVGLIPNLYSSVLQMPTTTATGLIAGVAISPIAANEYGWLQTWGLCSVLIAGTPALGATVVAPGAVGGAGEVITAANLVTAQVVGQMAQVGAAGKYGAVYLRIAP